MSKYEHKQYSAFLMHSDMRPFFDLLPADAVKKLVTSMFEYAFGADPDAVNKRFDGDDPSLMMTWLSLKQRLDADKENYQKRCATNSANAKKGKGGSDGQATVTPPPSNGRPIKENTIKDNTRHSIGANGKTYRQLDDGERYYWDDGSLVKDGDFLGG